MAAAGSGNVESPEQALKMEEPLSGDSNVESLKQALKKLEPLGGRLSALLRGRVVSQDHVWFRLAFLADKLSDIVAVLQRQLEKLPIYDDPSKPETALRLQELTQLADSDVGRLLDAWEQAPRCALPWRKVRGETIERSLAWLVWKGLRLTRDADADADAVSASDPELLRQEDGGCPLVGVDGATKKLRTWLTEKDDGGLKVVSIVGRAGVGKTALAMELYGQISDQFDCRLTAKMSRRPHKQHFLQHILDQISTGTEQIPAAEHAATHQTGRVSNLNQNSKSQVSVGHHVRGKMPLLPNLKPFDNDMPTRKAIDTSSEQMEVVSNIKKSLKNKRYLVVIDDIWDTSELGLKSSPLRENTIMKAWEVEDQDENESNEDQPQEGIKDDQIKMRNKEHWREKEINEDQAKKENNKDQGKEEMNEYKSEKKGNEDHTKKISNEDQAKEERKEDDAKKECKHNVEKGSKEDRTEKEINEDRTEVDTSEDEAKKVSKADRAEKQSSDDDDEEEKKIDHAKKERTVDQAKKRSNEVQADERSKEDHAKKGYKEYQDKKVIIDDRAEEENKEYHGQKKSNEDLVKEGQTVEGSQDDGKNGSKEGGTELETNVDQTDLAMNDDQAQLIENTEDEAQKGSQEEKSEKERQEGLDQAEKENEDKLLTFLDDWEFKSWTISEYKKKDWEIIKDAFPDDRCGSRIIVTTRISSIARFCCSSTSDGLVHEVKPLNDVDSERLFLTKAFGSENGCPPAADESRQACDEILRICEGIPMFITGMADIMKKKMQQSPAACDLEQVPQLVEQFEKELSYCYNDLFYGLELLPLSMSTALVQPQRKGCMIDKERLIRSWVREGLIYSDHWGDCEEKAERCFSELVDRNIIRLATFPGMTETCHCQVDPFVLQFLVSKSGKVNFVTTSNMLSQQASAAAGKKSRMILSSPHPAEMLEKMNLSSTLSLTISGAAQPVGLPNVMLGMGSLVVLDLEGWNKLTDDDLRQVCDMGKRLPLKYLSVRKTGITKLPVEIQVLLHLRELDIGGCTRIRELPLQVCRLKKLEALDLRNTRVRQLPEQIADLQGLRRLLLGQLDRVPWTETQQLPEGIRHITELRTLATVDLSCCSARFVAQALGGLTSLRVLSMTWSRHQCADGAYRDALWNSIRSWKRLKSLTIHCRLGCSMEFLAFRPKEAAFASLPQVLEMFKVIAGRFPAAPQWIRGLSRLASLQITVCSLARGGMEMLGSMPMLECLVLGLDYLPQEAAVIQGGGFRRLLTLSIDCRVPWLDFKQGAMPRLTHLEIRLSRVPAPAPASHESVPSGIGNLMSLEQVAVRYHAWYLNTCCVKGTVDATRKQVAELHYLVKLVINGIQDDVQGILEEKARATHSQTISKQ